MNMVWTRLFRSKVQRRCLGLLGLGSALASAWAIAPINTPLATPPAIAQTAGSIQPIRMDANNLEANAVTGVVTARGNVRITYPARNMQATSVQAQYYSREGRIVLSGNVYVLQNGNSLRAETITYLVNEGRFVANPDEGRQVEAIYLVPDPNPALGSTSASPAPLPAGATPNQIPINLPPLP